MSVQRKLRPEFNKEPHVVTSFENGIGLIKIGSVQNETRKRNLSVRRLEKVTENDGGYVEVHN